MTILLALTLLTGPTTDSWRYADAVSILGDYTPSSVGAAPAKRLDTPAGLTGCDEMRWYRRRVGLPERFDAIGFRESRCRNDVVSSTGCCVGYLELHRIVFQDHRTIPGMRACGATWQNVRGNDASSKQRQMCAAKVLFDVDGYAPWSL